MKKTPLRLSLPLLILGLSITCATAGTALIDETFNYTVGALSTPWTISNTTSGTTVNVEAADTFNGYTPLGNQITLTRPSGGGAPSAKLLTGANAGTSVLNASVGVQLKLEVEVSYAALTNTQGFQLGLQAGTINFAGVRFYNSSANGTTLQYMTTNSSSSFVDLSGRSAPLTADTWYKLTIDVTIDSLTQSTMNISLDQLGTGGTSIYSATGLVLTSGSSFSTTSAIGFYSAVAAGNISYSLANIDLTTVPEPSSAALLGLSGLLLLLAGQRFKRQC